MKPNDSYPYAIEDHSRVAVMEFLREASNGDRYYEYPVRGNNTIMHFSSPTKQAYFYRAMHRAESIGWTTVANAPCNDRARIYATIPATRIDGHQGWASFRKYSLGYLSPKHGYTDLLEVYAPGFIEWLFEIGVKIGKAELDDMSLGVGLNNSNGFAGNSETNKALKSAYGKLVNGGIEVNHTNVKGGLKAMANAVTPHIFIQSIKWIRLVNLRSVKS